MDKFVITFLKQSKTVLEETDHIDFSGDFSIEKINRLDGLGNNKIQSKIAAQKSPERYSGKLPMSSDRAG